jgi:O-acetylhomoserine/O-acetylserine sulfhydrylase-like pyridoxal-dependent enzyme
MPISVHRHTTPDQVRLSIGIEDIDDITWDLDQH